MKTVVLCGGKGTRIRDVSEELPKPMIPIGEYPILKHILDIYSNQGFGEFVICVGYKGWVIKEYFLNYRAQVSDVAIDFGKLNGVEILNDAPWTLPWKIIVAETGLEAMTGARVKKIQKYVGNERFMLTYGDGLANVDINKLVEFHKSHGKLVTITAVRPTGRFGELVLDGRQVREFKEKPQSSGGLINGGFFVCEPGAFDYLSQDDGCVFEREPLQRLAEDGQLMSFEHDGFWMPMDTWREFKTLNELWTQRKGLPPWLRPQDR